MKKLRKNSFWALYKPRSTCANVPMKTRTSPSPRQTTVSRKEAKNEMSLSKSRSAGFRALPSRFRPASGLDEDAAETAPFLVGGVATAALALSVFIGGYPWLKFFLL